MAKPNKNLPPEWKIKWLLVTKEQAAKWLKKCHTNRAINESVVDAYRRVMDAGLWDARPSQSPIAIDRDGNTINGQHRLQALVSSSVSSLLLPVITGCEPDDYLLFDQDLYVRSRAAQFRDRSNVQRDMARVRALEVLQTGDPRRRIPNSLFEMLADGTYKREMKWATEAFTSGGDQERAPYVAAFMYVYRVAPELAAHVANGWVNGGGDIPTPMLRVRDDAIRNRRGGNWGAMNESLRVLNGLMYLHSKRPMPRSLVANETGLRYWSALAKDDVADNWASAWTKRMEE